MRQRVGFARALVVEPDALLMDEPFSALDVLTAQNLRAELLRLWTQSDFPTKAMLIVTHNIEEAVILADRIFVLGANPGRIRAEIPVGFPQPRDRHDPAFEALVDEIYGFMTGRDSGAPSHVWTVAAPGEGSPVDTPLPAATVGGMAGLLEIVAARGGREDLPELASDLTFEVDDLLPLVDAVSCSAWPRLRTPTCRSARTARCSSQPTSTSRSRSSPGVPASAPPLCAPSTTRSTTTKDGNLGESFFLDLLRRGFTEDEAREQLRIAVDWGRYGELFDLDANTGQLTLDHSLDAGAA